MGRDVNLYLTYSCCSISTFVAFNSRCAKSISQLPTNSFLDEVVEGFLFVYLTTNTINCFSERCVTNICPCHQHFCNTAILETISSKTVRLRYHGNLWDLETLRPLSSTLASLGTLQSRSLRVSKSHRFRCPYRSLTTM